MPYYKKLDRLLAEWKNPETGLVVTLNSYNDGEPKVQIGPRYYKKITGKVGVTRPGRLTVKDILWISDIIEEIKEKINVYFQD